MSGNEIAIGDYADGSLDEAARAIVEAHLAGCASCRALAADFAALRSLARTLEPQVPPPHAWTRLAAALEERPRSRSWLSGPWTVWQPLAAAAMALLITAGLWSVAERLTPSAPPAATATGGTAERLRLGGDIEVAEAEYSAAIAGLERIHMDASDSLDPDTAAVVQANLTVLDDAIGESRAALQTQPDSELALESLLEVLRQKVVLLQDTIALINEMRQGNQEAAARIVSGLNQ